jgi:hypothetical protein
MPERELGEVLVVHGAEDLSASIERVVLVPVRGWWPTYVLTYLSTYMHTYTHIDTYLPTYIPIESSTSLIP